MARRWRSVPRILWITLLALPVLLAACSPSDPQNIFVTKSDFARMVADLFVLIIWLAAIVFVVVEAALIYALIKFRQRPGDGLPVQTHGNTKLEIILTIAPAVVL